MIAMAPAEPVRQGMLVAFATAFSEGIGLARDVSGGWVEIETGGRKRLVLARCCRTIKTTEPLKLEVV